MGVSAMCWSMPRACSFGRGSPPPADLAEHDAAKLFLSPLQGHLPRLQHLRANSAYSGKVCELIQLTLGCSVEIVKH
jgi:hypothetical protein